MKKISGYRYNCYWFGITRTGKIAALCNVQYEDEADLLADYDRTGDHGGLIRVYEDGTEEQIRPVKDEVTA